MSWLKRNVIDDAIAAAQPKPESSWKQLVATATEAVQQVDQMRLCATNLQNPHEASPKR